MTTLMSVFISKVKFIYLLVISAAIWLISIGLYWVSLAGWYDNLFMNDMQEGIPYFLSTFELITSVGFAVVFSYLYKELKMLPDKTFERIKYKTMTYLTLITILTNTRFLYNLTLMINNSFTQGIEHQFDKESLMPSYVSECMQCIFVLWHTFSRNLPKANNSQLQNEQ